MLHIKFWEEITMVGFAAPIMAGGGQYFASMPVYAGSRRQMGGGFFGTLKRFAAPILKKLVPHLANVGKRVAKSAINVGKGVVGDVIAGSDFKNIRKNIRKRGRREINAIGNEYIGGDILPQSFDSVNARPATAGQVGSGLKRRKTINKVKKSSPVAKKRKLAHSSPKKRSKKSHKIGL